MTGGEEERGAPNKTPWLLGIVFAIFIAVVLATVVASVGTGLLSIHPLLAIALNTVAGIGFAQPLWSWRARPTLRFAALGIALGAITGWLYLIFALLFGRY
ncbi:DUF2537 domain-containing protein [Hoyosella subflava]|uniref:DUF2537 domain-containing protein n=1 Tax=Hoyosella subflava TaxID=639313 RepID=UPI00059E36EE|nr:DUF2537 domain-containing protein [Hoyosella subflava]